LRIAGAIIIGKTTTPEFALLGRTHSRLLGVTRNPWDTSLKPGGSSGFAVASVAIGVTTFALGADMGGSTRLPASYTGPVGLRPSAGRLTRPLGFPPTALDFQAICPFARTMRDTLLLYDVLAGHTRASHIPSGFRQHRMSRLTAPHWLVHLDRQRGRDAGGRGDCRCRHRPSEGCQL
jgi:Asp-tRNA(Asn)/Glu-tRNA(Gln) amidotransferase A subunit family amidase